jgi:hypothetical protein
MNNRINALAAIVLAAANLAAQQALAQGFAAVVTPPRFEITAQAGERARHVIEITNAAPEAATYHVRTADWQLGPDASLSFRDELAPDSCRPWVAIERREISVPAGGQYRYRFEVQPPAGTADGECRFAIMIEGDEQAVKTAAGLDVPVSGRIAVIVYLAVGAAAPDLAIVGSSVSTANGPVQPVLKISNSGNAHGRLAGFLSGTDAQGRRLEFSPATLPILPGETRDIPLSATDGATEITDIAYPVTIKGVLELGVGRRVDIDLSFAR